MIKIISVNEKARTAQVVEHKIIFNPKTKKNQTKSETKHLCWDSKDQVWRDSKAQVVKINA
jgi:hypothetical protein